METRKHYDSIDGLRAFSAIGIICMHILVNSEYYLNGIIFDAVIPFFTNFVFLFMIISGFSMCCGYYEKVSNRQITLSQFYEKRYAKIWPFFAILVVLDIVLQPSLITIMEGFADLTLAFALLPNPNISVIGVGWTLGVIFIFYMLFPFFCFLLDNKKRGCFVLFITIVLNYMCNIFFMNAAHVVEDYSARSNFLYCSMYFLAGGLIYLYRQDLEDFVSRFHTIFLIFCVLITVVYFIISEDFLKYGTNEIGLLIFFSCWLIYAIGSSGVILNNRITKFISSVSMEIYLCHMMVFRLLERIHMNYLFGKGVIAYAIMVIFVLVGAIVFSIFIKSILSLVSEKLQRKDLV